jgi:hypothetical protein
LPFALEGSLWGVLIEKVERRKGCAGGGAGRCSFAQECERFGGPDWIGRAINGKLDPG